MTTATATALYIHDGGRVACPSPRCLGSAASSYLAAHPNAQLIPTSLGTWERFGAADVAEHGLTCETCG